MYLNAQTTLNRACDKEGHGQIAKERHRRQRTYQVGRRANQKEAFCKLIPRFRIRINKAERERRVKRHYALYPNGIVLKL